MKYKWVKVNCPGAVDVFGRGAKRVYVEDPRDWYPEWKAPKKLDLSELSGIRIKIEFDTGKSVVFWNSEWGGIHSAED